MSKLRTAIDVNAMGGSHTGTRSMKNVAVGNNTMAGAMNDADYNVAVGFGAMQSLTEGDANVVVGFEAGIDLTTGDDNTLLGYKAGENITASDQNVIIGSGAGATMASGINNCVLIGQAAGDSESSTFLKTSLPESCRCSGWCSPAAGERSHRLRDLHYRERWQLPVAHASTAWFLIFRLIV